MNYVSQWKEPIWLRLLQLFCAKRSFYHTWPPNKERFFHKVLIYKNVNISYIFTHCFFAVHLCSPWKCIRKTWQLRSNLRVYSVENEKEKLLITTEYILTQSHIFRSSGLQFSVEQAVSNCFAFYWHTETKVFWRTYITLSIEVTALSISSEESSLHRKLPEFISFICCYVE